VDPFIPIHVEGSNRETQPQRAALPRIFEGAPPKSAPPHRAAAPGLAKKGPLLHPRRRSHPLGVRVTQSCQRTRWRDGRVWLWLGMRKQTGRGEGTSGLVFDQAVDVKTAK